MSESIIWAIEAESRLKEVPFLARFLVRREIEKFARNMNSAEVTLEIYNLANEKWISMNKKN